MKVPEQFRVSDPQMPSRAGDLFGAFQIPGFKSPGRRTLNVIASDGMIYETQTLGWEHVSVSVMGASKQTPTWVEMCFIKSLFWEPDQCVIQFHPAAKDYVNFHEGVLHLWRCTDKEFPMPPKICV